MEIFMPNNKMKSLTVATALTIAAVGSPAFAEEVTVQPVDSSTTASTEASKTSANVKPALDAQQAVVDATAQDAVSAQIASDTAKQNVSNAQADVDAAKETVKDAEANVAKATPENIAAKQAVQAANLKGQEVNASDIDKVDSDIAAQTDVVADAKTAVDTAKAAKDAADSNVTAKAADVKSAQDAISGTGLAEAEANLDQAKKDVKTAETNVATATQAVESAKQADAAREAKVKEAETDVKTKTDAVNTTKAVLVKATNDVESTTAKLTETTDAVKKATDALANVDTVTIADLTKFKKDVASGDSDFMTDSGADVMTASLTKIGEDGKTKIVDVNNLSEEQILDLAQYNLQVVNAIRKQYGVSEIPLTDAAMSAVKDQIAAYVARNKNVFDYGHISNAQYAENVGSIYKNTGTTTVADLKEQIYENVMGMAFADAPSKWGHLSNIVSTQSKGFGFGIATFGGRTHIINMFDFYAKETGTPIANPEDPTALQAALTQAQADQAQAQTASDTAKTQLTKASADYATALDAKTKAEKVLEDVISIPLQTQAAENDLRLANIALTNAQEREVETQKAVDNFNASLAEKKTALDNARTALAEAQADQATKAGELDAAKSALSKQEEVLASLNADKVALLAEKDRLVEEAKALAAELKAYMEAPALLAAAQADLADKEAALADAQAKAELAAQALSTVEAKLAEEKAKLAELQVEYDTLKDLEDKAKDNTITTLPDGTIIAVPKVAPTEDEKPVGVLPVDNKVVITKPQVGVTVTTTANASKTTYSRVERANTLPQTGEKESLLALMGIAMVSSLGLAGVRKRRG